MSVAHQNAVMIRKAAANPVEMDRLIRTQVLEGVMGVRFNFYRGNWRKAFLDAQKQIPALDPQWVDRENTGCWQGLMFGIQGPLKSSPVRMQEDAEDIAARMLAGLTVSDDMNPKGSPFYMAGINGRDRIKAGTVRPNSLINRLKWIGAQRAIDSVNKAKTEFKNLGKEIKQNTETEDDYTTEPSSQDSVQTGDKRDALMNLLFDNESRAGKMLRSWLTDKASQFGRPGEIVQQLIDSGADTNREAAAALGVSEASISNALKVMITRVSQMPLPPALNRELDLAMETEQLGYRGLTASGRGSYMAIRELPQPVQRALKDLGYAKKDINVQSATEYDMRVSAGDGRRGFAVAVNLGTGQSKATYGDWGGSNMFSSRQVDLDDRRRPLPPNNVVIKGTSGNGVWAYLLINPENLQDLLPSPAEALSNEEHAALSIIRGLKSGYRSEYFDRHRLGKYHPSNPLIQGLAQKGLVDVRANGLMITTEGKNQSLLGNWAYWNPGQPYPQGE